MALRTLRRCLVDFQTHHPVFIQNIFHPVVIVGEGDVHVALNWFPMRVPEDRERRPEYEALESMFSSAVLSSRFPGSPHLAQMEPYRTSCRWTILGALITTSNFGRTASDTERERDSEGSRTVKAAGQ